MIHAWIVSNLGPVIAVVALLSFGAGVGAHRVWDKAGERDAVVTENKDLKKGVAAKDERDKKRAEIRLNRRTKEDELTTDLEKHLAEHPSDYKRRLPADGVRILNAI